jgi:hypothetical protein
MTKRKGIQKRLVLGDVIEIPLSDGLFAYAQFSNYEDGPLGWGYMVRVLPGVFSSQPTNIKELVQVAERFCAFFPAATALRKGLIRVVAREGIPEQFRTLPLFRACNRKAQTGEKIWYLWDGVRDTRVGTLSPEFYDLPLHQLISIDVLVERIEGDWSPRDEV